MCRCVAGQRSGSSGESEGGGSDSTPAAKDAPPNGRASGTPREEDSSDTDMEIKSLDLTGEWPPAPVDLLVYLLIRLFAYLLYRVVSNFALILYCSVFV